MNDTQSPQTPQEKSELEAYFTESRSWYAVAIRSVSSERYGYVLLSAIMLLTCLVALGGIVSLMPLQEEFRFYYQTTDTIRLKPRFTMVAQRGEDFNVAIRRFMASTYTQYHEAYQHSRMPFFARFVQSHSTQDEYLDYLKRFSLSNPENPITRYGTNAQIEIDIDRVNVTMREKNNDNRYLAKVYFIRRVLDMNGASESQWQASVAFDYTPITVEEAEALYGAEASGPKKQLEFKVTGYDVTPYVEVPGELR